MKLTHEKQEPITGEEFARMPNIERCELVRGTVVVAHPTFPRHARVEASFCHELRAFVRPRRLGDVLVGEAGLYTRRSPDTVRGADVIFLSGERADRCLEGGFLEVAPDLIVEVLSSSDRPAEVEEKVREYLECGVRLVWVADPERRTVRVYRPAEGAQRLGEGEVLRDPEVLGEDDVLAGGEILPGFALQVRRFFED